MKPIPNIIYNGDFFYEKEMPLRFYDFNVGMHFSNDSVLKVITELHYNFHLDRGSERANVCGCSYVFAGANIKFINS